MFVAHSSSSTPAESRTPSSQTAILSDSLADLSLIIHDFRLNVLSKISKKTGISLEDLKEKYASAPIQIPVAKTLVVPDVVIPEETIYKMLQPPPQPSSGATLKRATKRTLGGESGTDDVSTRVGGGLEAFRPDVEIPQLDAITLWNPEIHCHRRTKLGFCLRKQVKRAITTAEVEAIPKLCGGCMNVYFRQERGVLNTDWRGLVTEPFTESTNPYAYEYVSGRTEGNSYICSDGVRRRCSWFHTRFYRSLWTEEHGCVYYDDRTGMATKRLIGAWDRGVPSAQRDPISISSPDEIIDLRETLRGLGWKPMGAIEEEVA
jgi:hypothetical protein